VAVGDKFEPGDIICSIETDKTTVDFEMQDEGYIAKILYPDGTKDIPLGTVIAIVVEEPEDVAAFADYVHKEDAPAATPAAAPTPAPAAPVAAAPTPTPAAPVAAAPAKATGGRTIISPLARVMAEESGVNTSGLQGTGPGGRIIKADIQDHLAAGPSTAAPVISQPSADMFFTDMPNSQIRKIIADRLTFSK